MKTLFGKKLSEYQKKPVAKSIAPIEEKTLNLDIDNINESDFIQIPDSKYKIMRGYLAIEGEPIGNKNYVETLSLVEQINKATGKNYRLPYFEEVRKTYYRSSSSEFRESAENKWEWLNEIIIDKKEIVRDITNSRFVDNKFKFDGQKIPIKLSQENGYFDKLNGFGYPEIVVDEKPDNEPSYWYAYDGIKPVFRDWVSGGQCVAAIAGWDASGSDSDLSARLVKLD